MPKVIQPNFPAGASEAFKPKHREIFEILLREISTGRFRTGDRMPTEAELSKTFSASRTTIARAMRELKGQGLLDRQRGGGTRIARRENTRRIALFALGARSISDLNIFTTRLHAHLAEISSEHGDDLRLQFTGRADDASGSPVEQMMAAVDDLVDKGVNGVLLKPCDFPDNADLNLMVANKIRSVNLPVVLVGRDLAPFPDRSGLPVVNFDNRRAGYLVSEHLIQQGGQRILFVQSGPVSVEAAERQRGFLDAIHAQGLAMQGSPICRINLENPADCQSLLRTRTPDGIVCQTDRDAAIVARYVSQVGMRIGQDLLLAGFEDQPIADALPVPLTTVRFAIEPFAQVCCERLYNQMEPQPAADLGVTVIDVELVIRASTGLKAVLP